MTKKLFGVIGAGFLLTVASAASAQNICGPHEEIVKRLEAGYEETRAGYGLAGNGSLVELFVSKEGTWTFMYTRPDGITCLMAAGGDWEKIDKPIEASEELS